MNTTDTPLRTGVILALLWLAATAFNLTKAVHIDDTAYLEIAKAIRADPLHAMTGQISWVREREPIHSVNQPHLFFYFLAVTEALVGESELAFHLVESVFTLLALIFFFLLAQRFVPRHALFLSALFVLGPALLPGQNIMCDVPMLACWLIFLWAVLQPDRGLGHLVIAALAAAAACLIKYTSLVLLPVLILDLFWRRDWRQCWVIGIPLALLAVWSLFNYLDYGGVHLLGRSGSPKGVGVTAQRLLTTLICLGAVTPFTVLLFPRLLRQRGGGYLLLAAALVGAVQVYWGVREWGDTPLNALLRGVFLANGLLLLVWVLWGAAVRLNFSGLVFPDESQRPDAVFTATMLGLIAFLALLAPFLAVRHILPLVPILLILLGRYAVLESARFWRGAAFLLTVGLGVAIAVSDWFLADVYRKAAPQLMAKVNEIRQDESDSTVWYTGHWGWQWYARKAGMRQYDYRDSPLREGDYLVLTEMVPRQEIDADEWRRLDRIRTIVVPSGPATLLRTANRVPYGGYYAIGLKALPWTLSREPLDEFVIFRVGTSPRTNRID